MALVRNYKSPPSAGFLLPGENNMKELVHNKIVIVGGLEVIVRELTVTGLRNLLLAENDESVLDSTLFEDVRLSDLQAFTNLKADDISELKPSELRLIIDACKELNSDFFMWQARTYKNLEEAEAEA